MSTETEYEDAVYFPCEFPFIAFCSLYISIVITGSCIVFSNTPIWSSDIATIYKIGYTALASIVYMVLTGIFICIIQCYRNYTRRYVTINNN